jgi:hypothetical protein
MSKINIKIVEVDQSSHSVLVKYTSENSKKPIDEYPAVVFQVTNYNAKTVEEFIEAIRPQVSLYVWQRDQQENPADFIDLTGWDTYNVQVDAVELPSVAAPAVPALTNPEVTL